MSAQDPPPERTTEAPPAEGERLHEGGDVLDDLAPIGEDGNLEAGADQSRAEPEKGIEELGRSVKERVDRVARLAREREAEGRSEQPGEGTSRGRSTPHPILTVEGRAARLADVLALQLDDGDHAFSASTRGALVRACLSPVGETTAEAQVVGAASFMRAVLAEGARIEPPDRSATPGEALAAYLLELSSWDEAFRKRLVELAPGPAPNFAVGDAVADATLTRTLAAAAKLVPRLTPGQVRVDIRHAVFAALAGPEAQRVLFDLEIPGDRAQFLGALVERFVRFLEAHEPEDDPAARSALPTQLDLYPDALPPGPTPSAEMRFVADAPARLLADDRLGVADEARALAEVICLREPGPPLAIGLFGDWGSGKSTFMNMIEAAVDELTARTAGEPAASRTLVRRVVHVKFNAWHYNDANLWASLTSEFFSQLRSGGHAGRARADYDGLVRDVLARVTSLEREAASEAEAATQARRQTEWVQAEIADLEDRRRSEPARALAATVANVVAEAGDEETLEVASAMAALGHPLELPAGARGDAGAVRQALGPLTATLETEVDRAVSLPGRARVFGRALARAFTGGNPLTTALLYLPPMLAVALILLARWLDAATAEVALGSVVTTFLCAGGAALRVYRAIEPIFRATADYERRLEEGRRKLDDDIATKRRELETARQRLAEATVAGAKKEAEAARFRGGSPEQVWDYFLNVAAETRRFDEELGTVSRVRRAFEQLDVICRERASAAPDASIDRIVLYIDDLDRCRVEQVVRVLEAVHLLLAFQLFVVVVGVDARWLKRSLEEFYERQLHGDGTRPGGASMDPQDRAATVEDYLEKIFQIPVQLQSLSQADPKRFQAYLEAIAGPVEARRVAQLEPAESEEPRPVRDGAHLIHPVDVELKPRTETGRETVERITLRHRELAMMAGLAPFLGKSPRAVKRFMNIYRFVRGLHRGEALTGFLDGPATAPASHPAVQLWLAMDAGLRSEETALYHAAIVALAATGTLSGFAKALASDTPADAPLWADGGRALEALRKAVDPVSLQAHARALKAVAEALPGPEGKRVLLGAYGPTRRFMLRHV